MRQPPFSVACCAALLLTVACQGGGEPESSTVANSGPCEMFAECSEAKDMAACDGGTCVAAHGAASASPGRKEDAGAGGTRSDAPPSPGAGPEGEGPGGTSSSDSTSTGGVAGRGMEVPSATASQSASSEGGSGGASVVATGGRSGMGGAGAGGGAVVGGGAAGEGPETCEESAVRCGDESGRREQCEAGEWMPTDFVCATGIYVENHNGSSCAVKSDGTFGCWNFGGGEIVVEPPVLPGELKLVYPAVNGGTAFAWLLQNGIFVDESGSESTGVLDVAMAGGDVCLVSADGTANCSLSGPIPVSSVEQLAVSSMRCALVQGGAVYCDDRQDGALTLNGPYKAIAAAYSTLCALDTEGAASCAGLSLALPARAPVYTLPFEGVYSKLAMTDNTVCAISNDATLECATPSGEEAFTPTGSFVDIAGGDFTFLAIRTDGSLVSWFNNDRLVELPAGW